MDTITNLIKSLNSREKAYYKSANNKSSRKKPNHIRLFEHIDKYSCIKKSILKKNPETKNIEKYISAEKRYLMQRLIDSLVDYHNGKNIYMSILKGIQEINALMLKNQKSAAGKKIMKLKLKAYKYEEFNLLLLLIEKEEMLYFEYGYITGKDEIQKLEEERNNLIRNINTMNSLKIIIVRLQKIQFSQSSIVINSDKYPELFSNPLLDSKGDFLSVKAENLWLYANSLRFYLIKDYQACYRIISEQNSLIKNYPYLFDNKTILQNLSNYLYFIALHHDENKFESIIRELKDNRYSEIDNLYISETVFTRSFELYYKTNNYEKNLETAESARKFLEEHSGMLMKFDVNYLIILLLRAYIICDKYDEAFTCLKFRYSEKGEAYKDSVYKLYSFIIYYQLGYYELLDNEIHSWTKSLKHKRTINEIEKIMFTMFKRLINTNSKIKKEKIRNECLKKFSLISNKQLTDNFFEEFNFFSWCSRLSF